MVMVVIVNGMLVMMLVMVVISNGVMEVVMVMMVIEQLPYSYGDLDSRDV